MSKLGKIIFGTVIGLMAAALIFGIVYAVIEKTKKISADPVDLSPYISEQDVEISKYYKSTSGANDATSNIFVIFDSETALYTYANANQTLASGNFYVKGNEVFTQYQGTYSQETAEISFLTDKDGKYIFFESNVCSGDDVIPDSETFEATFTRVDTTGTGYKYEFKTDGTYTTTYGTANDCTTWKTVKGTYWRSKEDPNVIERTLNGEVETQGFPMYVFKGHLVDSIYYAISEEEYNADIKAYEEFEAEHSSLDSL